MIYISKVGYICRTNDNIKCTIYQFHHVSEETVDVRASFALSSSNSIHLSECLNIVLAKTC